MFFKIYSLIYALGKRDPDKLNYMPFYIYFTAGAILGAIGLITFVVMFITDAKPDFSQFIQEILALIIIYSAIFYLLFVGSTMFFFYYMYQKHHHGFSHSK